MKQLFIVLFMMNLGQAISAQDYIKEGTVWHTSVVGTQDPNATESIVTTEIIGDTLVNGDSGLKVYSSIESGPRWLDAIIKIEESKIYSWSHALQQWILAYDFSLKQGEGCYVGNMKGPLSEYNKDRNTFVKCINISNAIVYKGEQGDVMELPVLSLEEYDSDKCENLLGKGSWIVGIGSTQGFLSNNYFEKDGIGSILLDVWNSNELLMSMTNPTGIKDVSINRCKSADTIYNLNGEKCKTPRPGHLLYITKGKKILVGTITNSRATRPRRQ